jgi:hypothetical protein
MIDKDTIRTARRTVERNGYSVLPPRESDERDLNRFRTRRAMEREDSGNDRPVRPRYRDVVEDEPVRRPARPRYEEDRDEQPVRRFKPLRSREVEDEFEDRPQRPARVARSVESDDDVRIKRPAFRTRYDDDADRPVRPARREMNDDEKLGAAIRTAEENGYTIRKMTRLDQAKQVAKDHGYTVSKMEDEPPARPTRAPVTADTGAGNDKPTARPAPVRAQRPLVRPKANSPVADGIRTRTAPDTEIKNDTPAPAPATEAPAPESTPEPKKPTYADDFMNRAARFFGDDE